MPITQGLVDGRDQVLEAAKALNESGLLDDIKLDLSYIVTATGQELQDAINKFLDAVESIPANKEYLIPEIIYTTYNDIVTGKMVFLDEEVDGRKIIVKNDEFAFRRRIIPPLAPNNG